MMLLKHCLIIWKIRNFASFANMSGLRQLKKILEIKDFEVEPENLDRLKVELDFITLKWKLRKIESDIQKTGNLHVMMEQIRQMKRKQKTLATNILKSTRREAIKALLRDEKKRRRIKVHAMSLVERRKIFKVEFWKKKILNRYLRLFLVGV